MFINRWTLKKITSKEMTVVGLMILSTQSGLSLRPCNPWPQGGSAVKGPQVVTLKK